MPTTKCKIKFSKASSKLLHGKIKKTNLINLHIQLVETIALIFHSKVNFKNFFWLKLFILKIKLYALNLLIPRGNKRPHILKQTYFF